MHFFNTHNIYLFVKALFSLIMPTMANSFYSDSAKDIKFDYVFASGSRF